MFTYLSLSLIFLFVWVVLFFHRKDLRKKMIIGSIAVIPLAFFDYFSQPSYYHPQILFSLPIGIEGVIFGFAFGGIASVIYEEIMNVHLKRHRDKKYNVLSHIIVPLSVIFISLISYFIFNINMMISLPVGMIGGLFLMMIIRPNLRILILFSGLYFGLLYFFLLWLWLLFFPHAISWWNLSIYFDATVVGVPFGEVLFGFLYGALWGPLYEFLFDYELEKNN